MDKKDTEQKSGGAFGIYIAAGRVILRNRKHRRNILFGLTLLTLFLVFGGTVILGDKLMARPVAFLLFWLICFLSVSQVLVLAIYDIIMIRKDHRQRLNELNQEFHEITEKAKRLAESELKKGTEDD